MAVSSPDPIQPEIICPECNTRVSPEFTKMLLNGRTIYCEKCGFPFVGIQQGEVKPLEQSGMKIRDKSEADRRKEQWDEWRKQWGKIKDWIKDTINTSGLVTPSTGTQTAYVGPIEAAPAPGSDISETPVPPAPPIPPIPSVPKAPPIPPTIRSFPDSSTGYGIPPPPKPPYIPEQYQYPPLPPRAKKSKAKLEEAIDTINHIAPVINIFILLGAIISTFINITNSATFISMLGVIPLTIYILQLDAKEFSPRLSRRNYKYSGLDMIFVGFFGISAYGIGVLILARGILILILSIGILKDREDYNRFIRNHSGNSMVFWLRQLIVATVPYLSSLATWFAVAGILSLVGQGMHIGAIIPLGIVGIVCVSIFLKHVVPNLHKEAIEKTPKDVAIWSIVLGVFSMSSGGIGAVMLYLGISLIILIENVNKQPGITIIPTDVGEILNSLENKFFPGSLGFSIKPITQVVVPSPSISSLSGLEPTHRAIPRFDPETGKPLPGVSLRETEISPAESSSAPEPVKTLEPESLPPKSVSESEAIPRVFTVLSPEVRQKLQALTLSEQERTEIAEHLVYLAKTQQLKYLAEYEDANAGPTKEELAYTQRIQKLLLPEDQKVFLIQQLMYLPPTQQGEFVFFLERNTTIAK
jgi:hypothetical protein